VTPGSGEGLLDIKVKIGETPEGYEIFQHCKPFQFPVTPDQLASIAAKLHVQLPGPVMSLRHIRHGPPSVIPAGGDYRQRQQ